MGKFTPNFSKMVTAVNMASMINNMTGVARINSLPALNNAFGFRVADGADGATDASGFRVDSGSGNIHIGKVGRSITVDAFIDMTGRSQRAFLNNDLNFTPEMQGRMKTAVNGNFATVKNSGLAKKKGAANLKKAEADMPVPSGEKWSKFMGKFSKLMEYGVKGTFVLWTLAQLNELVSENTGCYLVGPDGQQTKKPGECNCLVAEPDNRDACCMACKGQAIDDGVVGGNADLICASDAADADKTPYRCPADPVPGASRTNLSVAAAAAVARATGMALASPGVARSTAAPDTCVGCGCFGPRGSYDARRARRAGWS